MVLNKTLDRCFKDFADLHATLLGNLFKDILVVERYRTYKVN